MVAAYRYDPFGVLLNQTGSLTQPYGFSTKRYDPQIGMVQYEYRPYFPSIGRWGTRDPLGEAGGMNLYAFVGNNPVNWVDPWGLWVGIDDAFTGPIDEILIIGGAYLFCRITGGCEVRIPDIGGFFAPDPPPADPSTYSCTMDDYVNPLTFDHLFDPNVFAKGGKQNVRDTGLAGLTDQDVENRLKDGSLSKEERRRLQKEQKARGTRNKQKRKGQ